MKPAYKPVLCVVSSHPIKGASGVPTGFFLAELTHPLKVLEDAGIKTTIASIRGGQPPVDGFDLSDPVNAWYWNETDFQQRLAFTLPRHMLTLPHFQFIYALMGAERILFSVDYPYQTLDGVKTFIDSLPVNKAEKEAIAFRNAERLLGITA